jgi:hypothetical protein
VLAELGPQMLRVLPRVLKGSKFPNEAAPSVPNLSLFTPGPVLPPGARSKNEFSPEVLVPELQRLVDNGLQLLFGLELVAPQVLS